MNKKLFFVLFIFAIILVINAKNSHAQGELNYTNPDSYNDPNFYAQADFNNPGFDWNKVDWNLMQQSGRLGQVDFSTFSGNTAAVQRIPPSIIPQLTSQQVNAIIISMTSDQRTAMNVNQWAYGNTLFIAGDIAAYPNAFVALNQVFSTDVTRQTGTNIFISENGILTGSFAATNVTQYSKDRYSILLNAGSITIIPKEDVRSGANIFAMKGTKIVVTGGQSLNNNNGALNVVSGNGVTISGFAVGSVTFPDGSSADYVNQVGNLELSQNRISGESAFVTTKDPDGLSHYSLDGRFSINLDSQGNLKNAVLDMPNGKQTVFRDLRKNQQVQTIGQKLGIFSNSDDYSAATGNKVLLHLTQISAEGFTQVKANKISFITKSADAVVDYNAPALGNLAITAKNNVEINKGSWKDADFVRFQGLHGTDFSLDGDGKTDKITIKNDVVKDGSIGSLTKGVVISDGKFGVQEEVSSLIVNKDGKTSFLLDKNGLQRIAARYGSQNIQTLVGTNMVVEGINGNAAYGINLQGVVGFEGDKNDVHLLNFQKTRPSLGNKVLMLSLNDEALFRNYGINSQGSNWQQAFQNLASLKDSNPELFKYINTQNPRLLQALASTYGNPEQLGVARISSSDAQNYLTAMGQSNAQRKDAANVITDLQNQGIVKISPDGKLNPGKDATPEQLITFIDANRKMLQSQISAADVNGKDTSDLNDNLNKLDLAKTNLVIGQKVSSGDLSGAAAEYASFKDSHDGEINEQARLVFISSMVKSGNIQQGVNLARDVLGDKPAQDYLVALNLLQRGDSAEAMKQLNNIAVNYPDSKIAEIASNDIDSTQGRYLDIIKTALNSQISQVDKDFSARVPEGFLGGLHTLINPDKAILFATQYFTSSDYASIANDEKGRLQRERFGIDAIQLLRSNGVTLSDLNDPSFNTKDVQQTLGGNINDNVAREMLRSVRDALQNEDVKKLLAAQTQGGRIGQFDFQTGTGYADAGALQQTWVDTALELGNGENLLAIVGAPAVVSALGRVGATVAPTLTATVPTFMRVGQAVGTGINYARAAGGVGFDLSAGIGGAVGVDVGTQKSIETLYDTYRYYAGGDLTDADKNEMISTFASAAGFATSSLFILPSGKAAAREFGAVFGSEVEENALANLAKKYDASTIGSLKEELAKYNKGEIAALDTSKFGINPADFKAAFLESGSDPAFINGIAKRAESEALSSEADNLIVARKAAASETPIVSEETTVADLIKHHEGVDGQRVTLGGEEFTIKVTDTGITLKAVKQTGPPTFVFTDGNPMPTLVFRGPLDEASNRISQNLKITAQQREEVFAGSVIKPREEFANGKQPLDVVFNPDNAGHDELPIRSSGNKDFAVDDRGEIISALDVSEIQESADSVNTVGLTIESLQSMISRGEKVGAAEIKSLDVAVNSEFKKLGTVTQDMKIDTLTGVTSYPHGSSDMIENIVQRGSMGDSTTDLLRLELKDLTSANGLGHEVGDDLVKKFMQQSKSYFTEKLGREVNVMRGPNGVLFVEGRINPQELDISELEGIITNSLADDTRSSGITGKVRAAMTEIQIPQGIDRNAAKDKLFKGLRESGAATEYKKRVERGELIDPETQSASLLNYENLKVVQVKTPEEIETFLRQNHNYVPPEIEEDGIFRVADQIERTTQAADEVKRLSDAIFAKGTASTDDLSSLSAANKALEAEQARLDVMASRPPRFESDEYDHLLNFKSGADLEQQLLTSGKPMYEAVGDLDWLRILLKQTQEIKPDADYAKFFKAANDALKDFEASHPGSTARLIKQANSDEYRIVLSGVTATDARQATENVRKAMENAGLSVVEEPFKKVNKITGTEEGLGSVTTTLSSKFEDLSGLTFDQLKQKTKEYDELVNLYKYAGKNVVGDGTLTQVQARKVMTTLADYVEKGNPPAWEEVEKALIFYSENLKAAGISQGEIDDMLRKADLQFRVAATIS